MKKICLLYIVLLFLVVPKAYANRIRVVGSSTLFSFLSYIAEEFGKGSSFGTPVIESVGSGAGFRMLCQGVGKGTADIAMSSRPIKDAERQECKNHKVNDIIEIILGYDGIVIANSKEGENFDFNKRDLFKAFSQYMVSNNVLKANNDYKLWSEINPRFSESDIEVYGPNKDTGTYDVFVNLVMIDQCMNDKEFINFYKDIDKRAQECSKIREDGKYIPATNENIIIQKIEKNSNALGIFSFSFLMKNQEKIKGNKLAGIEPNYQNVVSGKYILSRPLYLYIKKDHIDTTPGLKEFVNEITDIRSMGSGGDLAHLGFIPLSEKDYNDMKKKLSKILRTE